MMVDENCVCYIGHCVKHEILEIILLTLESDILENVKLKSCFSVVQNK